MRRTARLLVTSALLGGMVIGPLSLAANGAQAFAGTFGAVAAADALRVTMLVPHAPASDTVLDAGGPSAQATLDSIGGSQAYASFPYPGENTVTAPALIAGASGGQINLPAYPFWVGSSYPSTPEAASGSGAYAIKATSSDTSSSSSANVGLDSAGGALGMAKSLASTVSAPDAVTADARTEVTSFAIGPLRIGQVLSSAKAVFSADGTVKRDAETRVLAAKVGDTPVAFTEKGLVVGSSPIPADPKPVEALLAQAKIGVEYMPRQDTDTGVVAPTLRVTQRDESGQSITYVLGRASASAQGAGAPAGETDETTEAAAPSAPDGTSGRTPADAGGGAAPASESALSLAPPPGRSAEADGGTIDAPTSFVLPEPAAATATGGDGPGGASSQRKSVVATGSIRLAVAPEGSARRRAARLLISAGDTTPLFAVLVAGVVVALGSGIVLRRIEARMR